MANEGDIPHLEPIEPAHTFSGEEDVDQFITEFSDVAAICW